MTLKDLAEILTSVGFMLLSINILLLQRDVERIEKRLEKLTDGREEDNH